MEYRKMTSADLELIRDLEVEMRNQEPGVFEHFNEEEFKQNFLERKIEELEGYETILCLDRGNVVGRIDLILEQSFMDFKKVGYVDWVYTLKSYRKQGIARRLFDLAERFFQEHDCKLYYLFVAKNEEAQAFYKNIGIDIQTIERASKEFK